MRRGIIGVLSFWAGMGIVFTILYTKPAILIWAGMVVMVGVLSAFVYEATNER